MKMQLFTAGWCNPCTNLKEWLGENYPELKLEMDIIDIDLDMEAAMAAGVRGIPALVVDGKPPIATNERIRPFIEELMNEA